MNNVIRTAHVALALAFVGIVGCAVAPAESTPAEGSPVEEIGATAEALSSWSSRIDYYSDYTYTTLVGSKAMNCSGASSSWGIKTQYVIGEYDSCRNSTVEGCYQLQCDAWGSCDLACYYDYCVNC